MKEGTKILRCKHDGKRLRPDEPHYVHIREGLPDEYECKPCRIALDVKEFLATGRMSGLLTIEAILASHRAGPTPAWVVQYTAALDLVAAEFQKWQKEVWFGGQVPHENLELTRPWLPGMTDSRLRCYVDPAEGAPEGSLQRFVIRAPFKRYRAEKSGLTYSLVDVGASCLLRIRRGQSGEFVTLILDETSPYPRGGVERVEATADEAQELIRQAVQDWAAGLQFQVAAQSG